MEHQTEELFKKYLSGNLTAEELVTVGELMGNSDYLPVWDAVLKEEAENAAISGLEMPMAAVEVKQLYERIKNTAGINKKVSVILWDVIGVAAAMLIILSIAIYFYSNKKPGKGVTFLSAAANHDVKAGSNKAILTLEGGKSINLSDAKTGVVLDASKFVYNDGTSIAPVTGRIINLYTPRGGQYQLTLADGTKVWLNAASSLKFPSTFKGQVNREVELIGEAYFEVTKNKQQPFIVKTEKQAVEVLGTHFNINSYADEAVTKTTLLEGVVKVTSLNGDSTNQSTLLPNQQSIITNKAIKVKQVNAEAAIAWKNGNFIFDDEDLESILRKVARWYDVEIVYESKPEGISLLGAVSRSKNISAVLNALEQTGKVQFKIKGRRIIVMK